MIPLISFGFWRAGSRAHSGLIMSNNARRRGKREPRPDRKTNIYQILADGGFLRQLPGLNYTRLTFRGRQPLCGIGVISLIVLISSPWLTKALMAASRPLPIPLT